MNFCICIGSSKKIQALHAGLFEHGRSPLYREVIKSVLYLLA
jgi:hypothetical protein